MKELNELLLQALETEMGGVQVYQTALKCVENEDLKEEWEKYLDQTTRHVEIVEELLSEFGIDAQQMTPGRKVVHHIGESLVKAMEMALKEGSPEAAEIVACECVVLAETKDHLNWELLSQVAKDRKGKETQALKAACEEVETVLSGPPKVPAALKLTCVDRRPANAATRTRKTGCEVGS